MFLCKYDFLYLYCIYSFQYFLLLICLSIKNLFLGNDSIAEDCQNTEPSPGDLRRLAVTQTPVKNHQLILL